MYFLDWFDSDDKSEHTYTTRNGETSCVYCGERMEL